MRAAFLIFLAISLVILVAGCSSVKQAKLEELEDEIGYLETQLDEVRLSVAGIRTEFGDLEYRVGQFSTGASNWSDVIVDVRAEVSELDHAIEKMEAIL